jgi:hypothetical protein
VTHEAGNQPRTLLAVTTPAASWGVPGGVVAGVGRLSEWTGPPPLDVGALLGATTAPSESDEARIVMLATDGEQLPLLATGSLSLLHTTADQLLELPQALRRSAPVVAQVALLDGAPRLFVLDPRGLLEAWRNPQATPATELPPSAPR